MKKIFFKRKNGGYTIIETMISISLFLVVVMSGMGALLNANLLHQKSQNMRSVIDNLNFIMEDLSRNLRTGYNYHCIIVDDFSLSTLNSTTSGAGCWGIAFESEYGSTSDQTDQWVYFISNGKIFKATHSPYTNPSSDPSSGFVQITPNEIVIDPVSNFSVMGAGPLPTDQQQPFVRIRLVGKITLKNIVTPFSLQTSVSQRLVDI